MNISTGQMNEKEAVRGLNQGDRQAFKYLFDKYYDRIVAYIMTYTNDKVDSEDIVQQAFIDLWADRQKLDVEQIAKGLYLCDCIQPLYR